MTYKGRKTTRPEVAIDIQRTDLRGAMGPDMVLWAREKGMEARFAASNLKELLASIKNQNPVIVLLDVGLGPVRKGHFAVAVGYGPEGLIVNSGMIQQQILPWPDFVKQWRKMRNFSIFVTGLAKSRPQPPAPGVGPGPGPGSGPGQRPGQGKGAGQGASRGAPLDDDNRVLSPTKVSQQLNLPEGVDVPEEMTSAVTPPKYELPTQKVPDFLSGAELPQAGEIPQNPIVDMTGRAPVVAPISPDDEEEIESSALSGQSQGQGNEGAVKIHETGGSKPSQDEGPAKAGADLKVVMEPLPLPGEEDSGGGFSETDLGNPLILPVVPLPEDQPITGSKMGSDFKGPATVPGAVTPNQASQTAKAEGDKAAQAPVNKAAGENQDGTKAAEEEELPVMEWERQ
jgi:hypothetical protein